MNSKKISATRKRCGLKFTDPTRTQQSFANETNINKIMARYKKTGHLPSSNKVSHYGDFTNVATYQEAIDKISEAENMFMDLPSHIRAHFANNPAIFLEYATNPQNLTAMQELGLLPPSPPPPDAPKSEETPPSPPPKDKKQSTD